MGQVRVTEQADVDLLEIALYISQDDPRASERFIDKIAEKCRLLATASEIGPMRPEIARQIRSFPCGSYIIFYRAADFGIEVIRVLHGARDLPPLFE
jgi:toxin ParE1/3/4